MISHMPETRGRAEITVTEHNGVHSVPVWFDAIQVAMTDGASLTRGPSGWSLWIHEREIRFRLPADGGTVIFEQLASGGCSLANLAGAMQSEGRSEFLRGQIQRLWSAGLISQTLFSNNAMVASCTNTGPQPFMPRSLDFPVVLVWSPTAHVRVVAPWLVLESAESGSSVKIDPARTDVIDAIRRCAFQESLDAPEDSSRANMLAPVLSWLLSSGFLRAAIRMAGEPSQPEHLPFADQMMHARSRRGRHLGGYGASKGANPARPAPASTRPIQSDVPSIMLPRPDMEALFRSDRPLTAVLEQRRSVRRHGDQPLSKEALGEFLFRVARVRSSGNFGLYEVSTRPYPSGGALYSVDFNVVVNRSTEIPRGFYHYDGLEHRLIQVSVFDDDLKRLIDEAVITSGASISPHVLIVLSTRFERVSWKYESIAYSLILKEVGVIYQTMYLVATAMNLAGCALGGGDSDLYCKVSGHSYWVESSVGEFLLGDPA